MWFEIIPSFAIITVALAIPGYALYGANKLVLGTPYRRSKDQRWDRLLFHRDHRLTEDPYNTNGLEVIPDLKE